MDAVVAGYLQHLKDGLTLDGRQRVFKEGKELDGSFISSQQDPEEYTKRILISPILDYLNCTIDNAERRFAALRKNSRKVDYTFYTSFGTNYLLEAKPLNADLFIDKPDGAVNQIKDAFRLTDVVKIYEYGIATDGRRWVFFNNERECIADFNIETDFESIKEILCKGTIPELDKEEISKKFYRWYSALLFGGSYSNHEGKPSKISKEDCLVNSVLKVDSPEDSEKIAQTVIDRLIFIKFLESKSIIKNKVIHYMSELEEDRLDVQMKSLFFDVMSTKVSERDEVNHVFKDIPYLNGSLFVRIPAEMRNPDYKIKAKILKEVFTFLDSFTFSGKNEDQTIQSLDPEILGYIFEMSMLDTDRKGTGAFYTPKEITTFLSKEAIHKKFVENVKHYLRSIGYSDLDVREIHSIDDVYNLSDIRLASIFNDVLSNFRICDNACGSGAFLLSAADIMFDIYKTVNNNAGMRNTDIILKKLILMNNLYGVDLNSNAVEIAKLRLWLWLVDAYKPTITPEALPNIDYNICVGNSLIGYIGIEDHMGDSFTLDDFIGGRSLKLLLAEQQKLINEYKHKTGREARSLKKKIDEIASPIREKLSNEFFAMYGSTLNCTRSEFLNVQPFHWGFEFSEVFEEGGFDVIIGNPPYVQLQRMTKSEIKEIRVARQCYELVDFKTFASMGDIYCLFYERSNNLLKSGGILSYITSNKWMKADYGKKLRGFFITDTHLSRLVDLTGLKVFKDATVESGIVSFIASKNSVKSHETTTKSCLVDNTANLKNIENFVIEKSIDCTYYDSDSWNVSSSLQESILKKISTHGKPLGEQNYSIYYGIKTGFNEAFLMDEEIKNKLISEDPRSEEIIKPVLSGENISRYSYTFKNQWILGTFPSLKLNISDYPAVENHLLSFGKKRLAQSGEKNIDGVEGLNARKKTNNDWFEVQDSVSYWNEFQEKKIIWGNLSTRCKFAFDDEGYYINAPSSLLVPGSKSLLAILNSKLIDYFLHSTCVVRANGYLEYKPMFIKRIPIIDIDDDLKDNLEKIVDSILKMKNEGIDTTDQEKQIDKLIYHAYDLTDDEIAEVESKITD